MCCFVIIGYIIGILVTHHIIYKVAGDPVEPQTANIASAGWPLFWLLFGIVAIIKGIKYIIDLSK